MMVDPKKFERLSILSQQLNQQTDTLNDTIAEWNKRLESLHLGAEVWLEHCPLEDSGDYYTNHENGFDRVKHRDRTYLGYCRLENAWQLAIKEEYCTYETDRRGDGEHLVPDVDAGEYTRLLSASRDLRIKAVSQLDRLIEALEKHVTKGLETVAKAQKLAEMDKP